MSLAPFSPVGGFLIPPEPKVSKEQRVRDARSDLAVNYQRASDPSGIQYVFLEENSSVNFVYPRTNIPTFDRDPFRQCTVIRLPRYIAMEPSFEFLPELRTALRLQSIPDNSILLGNDLLKPGDYRTLEERNGIPRKIDFKGKTFEGIEFQLLRPGWTVVEVPEERRIVAFSRVCVHLLCLWSYLPLTRFISCPCHGSTYLASHGAAVAGPAFLQPAPNNVLPEVKIQLQEDGTIMATDIEGIIGTGRPLRVSQLTGLRVG